MPLEEKDANDGASKKIPSKEVSQSSAETKRIDELEAQLKAVLAAQQAPQPIQTNQGITPEALEAILTRVTANSGAQNTTIGDSEFAYVEEAQIDEEDWLEEGHTFWNHGAGYVIVDDKRNNKSVMTPLKTKIIFEYHSTTRTGTGKEINLRLLSKYVSHSKKEVKWLKEHTVYNSIIFDDLKNNTMSRQAKKASRLAAMIPKLRSMERTQLATALKTYNIPYDKDFEVMYLALAEVYVEMELLEDKQRSEQIARNHAVEQEMIETLTS